VLDRTIQSTGIDFEMNVVIIAGCSGHENRDKISLGPGSARVGSEHLRQSFLGNSTP
jgi:hypothetical protein